MFFLRGLQNTQAAPQGSRAAHHNHWRCRKDASFLKMLLDAQLEEAESMQCHQMIGLFSRNSAFSRLVAPGYK